MPLKDHTSKCPRRPHKLVLSEGFRRLDFGIEHVRLKQCLDVEQGAIKASRRSFDYGNLLL
ncbi:hypothetical protein D3C81_2234210 [compost metagenome]